MKLFWLIMVFVVLAQFIANTECKGAGKCTWIGGKWVRRVQPDGSVAMVWRKRRCVKLRTRVRTRGRTRGRTTTPTPTTTLPPPVDELTTPTPTTTLPPPIDELTTATPDTTFPPPVDDANIVSSIS